jgi:hypothetical protein
MKIERLLGNGISLRFNRADRPGGSDLRQTAPNYECIQSVIMLPCPMSILLTVGQTSTSGTALSSRGIILCSITRKTIHLRSEHARLPRRRAIFSEGKYVGIRSAGCDRCRNHVEIVSTHVHRYSDHLPPWELCPTDKIKYNSEHIFPFYSR